MNGILACIAILQLPRPFTCIFSPEAFLLAAVRVERGRCFHALDLEAGLIHVEEWRANDSSAKSQLARRERTAIRTAL